jgi:hypothetical protein
VAGLEALRAGQVSASSLREGGEAMAPAARFQKALPETAGQGAVASPYARGVAKEVDLSYWARQRSAAARAGGGRRCHI